jgi:transcriptional regulator GlxA family with amidase domain
VLFKEGGIRAFSKIPAHELFGLSIPAANLFPSAELDELVERLAEANTNPTRIQLMEDFLRGKLCHSAPDLLISKAIQLIHDNNGIIRIKELVASLPVSQDPFEKRFRSQVGTTPKQYSSIVRLRSLIRRYPTCSSLTQAAHAAGYFDQSHFIKDFRLFTGQAPKDFFQSTRYW